MVLSHLDEGEDMLHGCEGCVCGGCFTHDRRCFKVSMYKAFLSHPDLTLVLQVGERRVSAVETLQVAL